MQEGSGLFLVTGGCGFIGTHLCHALVEAGHKVRILDDLSTGKASNAPAGSDLMIGDVSDSETVADAVAGTDGVFHLAAVASVELCNRSWLRAHRTNLGGTIAVMEAARDAASNPLPVIWASSAAIYGAATEFPISETTAPAPMSPYGADKLGGELHGRAAAEVFRLPNTAMRFFNVYGPGQDPHSPYSGVISIFAERLARGEDVTIYGDGGQTRDFVFVGDVVGALMSAMERQLRRGRLQREAAFDAVNVCTGTAITVLELAETLRDLTGGRGEIHFAPSRSGDIRESLGDASKLSSLLQFRAATPLAEGLAQLLDTPEERLAEAV